MKQLNGYQIWCTRIALSVCIGAGVGFWTTVAIGRYLVQGIPSHGAGYIFIGYTVLGGIAGAAIGLVFGLLYAVTQTIAAYYRRKHNIVNHVKTGNPHAGN